MALREEPYVLTVSAPGWKDELQFEIEAMTDQELMLNLNDDGARFYASEEAFAWM